MPMAAITSALRRLASARLVRAAPCSLAALIGLRVNASVQMVSDTSTTAPAKRHKPDQRVKQEADREIGRDPGQIEKARASRFRQESSGPGRDHAGAAGSRFLPDAPTAGWQSGRTTRAQPFIKRSSHAQQKAAAEKIEGGLAGVEGGGQDREGDKGGDAPARNYPVIDLEHVK